MTAEQLLDWIAICELKARYCRFLDTKRWEEWGALFTDDILLDTSEAGGPPPISGREAVVASVRAAIDPAVTAHQVHNPEIVIEGDTASGIWAMQDRIVFAPGAGLTGYGHYAETYRRQDGGWRISVCRLTRLHLDSDAAPGGV